MSIIIGFGTIGNETQIDARKSKLNRATRRKTCRYKCICMRTCGPPSSCQFIYFFMYLWYL